MSIPKKVFHNHDEVIHYEIYNEKGKVIEHTCIAIINEGYRRDKKERVEAAAEIIRRYNAFREPKIFEDLLAAVKDYREEVIESSGEAVWDCNYSDIEAIIAAAEKKE